MRLSVLVIIVVLLSGCSETTPDTADDGEALDSLLAQTPGCEVDQVLVDDPTAEAVARAAEVGIPTTDVVKVSCVPSGTGPSMRFHVGCRDDEFLLSEESETGAVGEFVLTGLNC